MVIQCVDRESLNLSAFSYALQSRSDLGVPCSCDVATRLRSLKKKKLKKRKKIPKMQYQTYDFPDYIMNIK